MGVGKGRRKRSKHVKVQEIVQELSSTGEIGEECTASPDEVFYFSEQ